MRLFGQHTLLVLLTLALMAGCGGSREVIKVHLAGSDLVQPTDADQLAPAYLDLGPAPVYDERILKGISLYHQARFDDARNVLAGMLFEERSQWQVYYVLGLIDYRLKDYEQAQKSFLAALWFCPDENENRPLVFSALALSLERAGDFGRARQNFQTACDLDPKSQQAQAGLVRLTTLTAASDR